MIGYLTIIDDDGETLVEHEFDPGVPSQWRTPPGKKIIADMPQNSEQNPTGTYELFGFVYQPQVRVSRPNGYNPPPPVPWQGIPMGSPKNGQSFQQGTNPGLASSTNQILRG